jgi:hypothetical protein
LLAARRETCQVFGGIGKAKVTRRYSWTPCVKPCLLIALFVKLEQNLYACSGTSKDHFEDVVSLGFMHRFLAAVTKVGEMRCFILKKTLQIHGEVRELIDENAYTPTRMFYWSVEINTL